MSKFMNDIKKFYGQYYIIVEDLHPHLQEILDKPGETEDEYYERINRNPYSSIDPVTAKHTAFTEKVRKLINAGNDTGLESDKPKKGSSRAVHFLKEGKNITVDGVKTKVPSVLKIAFNGQLDKYKRNSERLLGEHQNEAEADGYIQNHHSILRENPDGTYLTNENGVVAPVLSHHPDHHYLEMGQVRSMKAGEFTKLTKTSTHPKGLTFAKMKHVLEKEHADAFGQTHFTPPNMCQKEHDHILQHPLTREIQSLIHNVGFHPGDLSPRNVGIFTHPVTGKEYPVISDYGFTNDVAKEYTERRKRHFAKYF